MVNYSLRRLGIESAWNIPPGCGKGEQSKQQQQQREPLCDAAADQRHPDSVLQLELRLRSCRFPSLCGRLGRGHVLGDTNTLHSGMNESTSFHAVLHLIRTCVHHLLLHHFYKLPITYFVIRLNYHIFAFRLLQYLRALFSPIHRWTIIWCCYSQRGWKFRWEHTWPTELRLWEEWEEWISQEQAMGVIGELKETPRWRIRMS